MFIPSELIKRKKNQIVYIAFMSWEKYFVKENMDLKWNLENDFSKVLAYNVQKALFACNPCEGNMELVYSLWRTQTKRFKSASQNYSQLILAAMFEMDARRSELQLAKL